MLIEIGNSIESLLSELLSSRLNTRPYNKLSKELEGYRGVIRRVYLVLEIERIS